MAGEVRTHYLIFKLDAADPPSAPTQGSLSMYTKGDNSLYYKDNSGTEYQLQTGAIDSCCTIIPIDGDTEVAYRVHQGASDYIKINTTNAAQTLTLGDPELSSLGIFFKSMDVTSVSENFSVDANTGTSITTRELNVSIGDGSNANVAGAKRLDVVASEEDAVWNIVAPYDGSSDYVETDAPKLGRLHIGGLGARAAVAEGSGVEYLNLAAERTISTKSKHTFISATNSIYLSLGGSSYEGSPPVETTLTHENNGRINLGGDTAGQKTYLRSPSLQFDAASIIMADGATIDGLDPSALATTAGAGMIGIEDVENNFTSDTVEGALSELAASGGGGAQGPAGPEGPQGPAGADGADGAGLTPAGNAGDVQTNDGAGGLAAGPGIATAESAGTSGKLLKVADDSSIDAGDLITINAGGELIPVPGSLAQTNHTSYFATVTVDDFGRVTQTHQNRHHVHDMDLYDVSYANPSAPLLDEYALLPEYADAQQSINPYYTLYNISGHARIHSSNYGFSPVRLPDPQGLRGTTITICYSNRNQDFNDQPSDQHLTIQTPSAGAFTDPSFVSLPQQPDQMIALIPSSESWAADCTAFISNQTYYSTSTSFNTLFNWPKYPTGIEGEACPAFFLSPGGTVTLTAVKSVTNSDNDPSTNAQSELWCWQITAHHDRYPQYLLASASNFFSQSIAV